MRKTFALRDILVVVVATAIFLLLCRDRFFGLPITWQVCGLVLVIGSNIFGWLSFRTWQAFRFARPQFGGNLLPLGVAIEIWSTVLYVLAGGTQLDLGAIARTAAYSALLWFSKPGRWKVLFGLLIAQQLWLLISAFIAMPVIALEWSQIAIEGASSILAIMVATVDVRQRMQTMLSIAGLVGLLWIQSWHLWSLLSTYF